MVFDCINLVTLIFKLQELTEYSREKMESTYQ